MKCEHCGHTWESRVPNPVQCPKCKRSITPVHSRKQVKPLELTIQDLLPNLILCDEQGCIKIAMFKIPTGGNKCVEHTIDYMRTVRQVTDTELLEQVT